MEEEKCYFHHLSKEPEEIMVLKTDIEKKRDEYYKKKQEDEYKKNLEQKRLQQTCLESLMNYYYYNENQYNEQIYEFVNDKEIYDENNYPYTGIFPLIKKNGCSNIIIKIENGELKEIIGHSANKKLGEIQVIMNKNIKEKIRTIVERNLNQFSLHLDEEFKNLFVPEGSIKSFFIMIPKINEKNLLIKMKIKNNQFYAKDVNKSKIEKTYKDIFKNKRIEVQLEKDKKEKEIQDLKERDALSALFLESFVNYYEKEYDETLYEFMNKAAIYDKDGYPYHGIFLSHEENWTSIIKIDNGRIIMIVKYLERANPKLNIKPCILEKEELISRAINIKQKYNDEYSLFYVMARKELIPEEMKELYHVTISKKDNENTLIGVKYLSCHYGCFVTEYNRKEIEKIHKTKLKEERQKERNNQPALEQESEPGCSTNSCVIC